MNVVIVEDERPAAERLRKALAEFDPKIEVLAHLQTVNDTVGWLETHRSPDLLFLDVRLTDGLSLEIFGATNVDCPVIFTTAYDAYVLDAFDCNSIDYLLKPVRPERLARAMRKYEHLRRHFAGEAAASLGRALQNSRGPYKTRLLVQRGTSYVSIEASEICYAVSRRKTTFVIVRDGTQYLCDEALTSLEEVLDPERFFRLSRSVLAGIDAVSSFKSASRGRVKVELTPHAEVVLVSQEKAGRFRAWMDR